MPTANLHTRSTLTQARLKEAISYDPETGQFMWRVTRKGYGGGVWPGKPAGQVNAYGYLVICLDQERHFAHRLAWLYMTGEWPTEEVDHADRDQANNRWENLRAATSTQQKINTGMRCDNTSGVRGVRFDLRRGRWVAVIGVNKKSIHLGRFRTIEEATDARRAAELQHFGEFAPA